MKTFFLIIDLPQNRFCYWQNWWSHFLFSYICWKSWAEAAIHLHNLIRDYPLQPQTRISGSFSLEKIRFKNTWSLQIGGQSGLGTEDKGLKQSFEITKDFKPSFTVWTSPLTLCLFRQAKDDPGNCLWEKKTLESRPFLLGDPESLKGLWKGANLQQSIFFRSN